jgi:glyoxylase-like metal-dependent hydrolase (beta-lactamase superfamily II)
MMEKEKSRLTNLGKDLFKIDSFGSNIYLINENGNPTLIDAGFQVDLPHIWQGLKEADIRLSDLDLIVATHYHVDHVGPVPFIKRLYKVCTAIHEKDKAYAIGEEPYERFEVPLSRLIFYSFLWPIFRYRSFGIDLTLKEGDILDLLGGLEVFHTPGHTIGSICLYSTERKILFSGDLVRNENGTIEGPPIQFTPDPDAAADSLRKIAKLDFETLLPGHGDVVLEGAGDLLRSLIAEGKIWPLSGEEPILETIEEQTEAQ